MRPKLEKAVCDFVRSIVASATSSAVLVTGEPDRGNRSTEDVEELWASSTRRFAIEHSLLESVPGQIRDDARFAVLLEPLRMELVGRVSGTYDVRVEMGAAASARGKTQHIRRRIADAVTAAALTLGEGEVMKLEIEKVPFFVLVRKRDSSGSRVVVSRWTYDDVEPRRLDRVRRALDDKCAKLATASADGRLSILALESNDGSLANYNLVALAVKEALVGRTDTPSIVMVVETDGGLFHGWTLWNNTDIALNWYYLEGQF